MGKSVSHIVHQVTNPIGHFLSQAPNKLLHPVENFAQKEFKSFGHSLGGLAHGLGKGAHKLSLKGVAKDLTGILTAAAGPAPVTILPPAQDVGGGRSTPVVVSAGGGGGISTTMLAGIAAVGVLAVVLAKRKKAFVLALAASTALTGAARAAVVGKLDLSPDMAVFTARQFAAAPVMFSGVEKTFFRVQDDSYTVLEIAPVVGWEMGGQERVLGGLDISAPLGSLANILRVVGAIQDLPPRVQKLDDALSHVKTGIIVAWDPRYIAPAFIGYKIAVTFGANK